MRRITVIVMLFGVVLLSSIAAAEDSQLGETVFKQKCAGCHGADGKGNPKMSAMLKVTVTDLTTVGGKTNAELTKFISEGKKPMPAFGKSLSPQELDAVTRYVQTLAGGGATVKK